jgi:5-(carboxyamino)imidazole ribonucleotide synthase
MTIGVLGGGQLGRMLALAAYPLGETFVFLDPSRGAPAGQVGDQVVGAYDDLGKLAELAKRCRVVTYEFESVPVDAARFLEAHAPVYPPPRALEVAQDRLREKNFVAELGIATSPYFGVSTREELTHAVAALGLPVVAKTRRFGYDGKGQAVMRTPADVEAAWETLSGAPLIVERFVPFVRELSILGVRGKDGTKRFWPLVENRHERGILRRSTAPAPFASPADAARVQADAEALSARILDALEYVGVLAVELFDTDAGLVVNEMAPRVHNSGHWTIEGSVTSQFENHVRAILGLPLGDTATARTGAGGASVMINLIGGWPERAALLALPHVHLHLYGKTAQPGRKVGHVTIAGAGADTERLASEVEAMARAAGSFR